MTNQSSLVFRPDIEGLRALAILLVVAAHIKAPYMTGGFIGVDVFFVISGFLMTGLIVNEINETGTVRLFYFYARRLQRLLPMLLLVFFATIASASVFLSPLEQIQQIGAARLVPLWLSNFHFAATGMDYFGPQAESNLFLHTWSLGVEEQFYLVWPALILFLMGSWKWQEQRRNESVLVKSLGGVLIIGFLFSLFLSWVQPKLAFYSMPARIWQFTAGGMMFLMFARPGIRKDTLSGGWVNKISEHRKMLAYIGLLGIFCSAVILDGKQVYPGYWALLPTIATCVVLASCSGSNDVQPWLINNAAAQFIGKISYGWYLWHWPVLLIGSLLITDGDMFYSILMMLFALLLAFISYHVFENPIRKAGRKAGKPIYVILGSLVFMMMGTIAVDFWSGKAYQWAQSPSQLAYQASKGDLSEIYKYGCDDWYHSSDIKPCIVGNPKAENTAVLLGDSIGAQWYGAAASAFSGDKWRFIILTKSSCPMVDAKIFYPRIGREYTECEEWRNKAVDWIGGQSPDVVILGSALSNNLSERQWTDGSSLLYAKLSPMTSRLIVIAPGPMLPFDGPDCLAKRDWKPAWAVANNECQSALKPERPNLVVGKWLEQAAAKIPNAEVVYIDNLVCPNNQCQALQNGVVVFRDSQHLTNTFVRSIAKPFAELLNIKQTEYGEPEN